MSVVSRGTTNQMHYPVVGSDTSSAMRARSSDDISRGNQWWRRKFKFWLFSYVPEEPLLSWEKFRPLVKENASFGSESDAVL